MGKRGRPKGSKNKVSRGPAWYSIGTGTQFKFPIVREGNVRMPVAMVAIAGDSFALALMDAVAWALRYSEEHGHAFWPLVRYRSQLANEKRYVMKAGVRYAYAESKDAGAWLPVMTLEAL